MIDALHLNRRTRLIPEFDTKNKQIGARLNLSLQIIQGHFPRNPEWGQRALDKKTKTKTR